MPIKVTRDRAGIHIFLDRARVPARIAKDDRPADEKKLAALKEHLKKIPDKKSGLYLSVYADIEKLEHKLSGTKDAMSIHIEYSSMGPGSPKKVKSFSSKEEAEKWELAQSGHYKRISYTIKNDQRLLTLINGAKVRDADLSPDQIKARIASTEKELRTAEGAKKESLRDYLQSLKAQLKTKDTTIKAPPPKVSNTKTSEQARVIAAQLKKSKDCSCGGKTDDGENELKQMKHLNAAGVDAALRAGGYSDNRLIWAKFQYVTSDGAAKYGVAYKGDDGEEESAWVFVRYENGRFVAEFA